MQRRGMRTIWIVLGAAVAAGTFALWAPALWSFVSKPEFVVTRGELQDSAPKMLRTYRSFAGPTLCDEDVVCMSPTCRTVHETVPFDYRSVCYFGKPGDFTVMFSSGRGDHYRVKRGVFYRPDTASPEPDGVCIRHVFGRWWEFAPMVDEPSCPSGFDTFTGEA